MPRFEITIVETVTTTFSLDADDAEAAEAEAEEMATTDSFPSQPGNTPSASSPQPPRSDAAAAPLRRGCECAPHYTKGPL